MVFALFCALFLLLVAGALFGAGRTCAYATPGVDDYPAKYKAYAEDALVDEWRFYNRECTSFVAWRLNNDNNFPFTNFYQGQQFGNANHWGVAAKNLGITVDSNPAVGSVAWTTEGSYGHVAWVWKVDGNMVTIEEYAGGNYKVRTLSKSNFNGFIHFADLDSAANKLSSAAEVSIEEGSYTIHSAVGDKVLDIAAGSTDNGANAQIYTSNGTQAQIFDVSYSALLGSYGIGMDGSDKLLDTAGNENASGVNVFQWEETGVEGQRWTFQDAGDGYVYIHNQWGYYLDVCCGIDSDGTNVEVYEFNGSDAQKWKLTSGVSLDGFVSSDIAAIPTSYVGLYGSDRYDTMHKIASAAFSSSSYAVLVTGQNFPDALSCVSLAGILQAPVILVGSDPSEAIAAINELSVAKVFVIGGTDALSDETLSTIESQTGVTSERLCGDTRQASAASIANVVTEMVPTTHTAIIATGSSFADALSIGCYAYETGTPLYLTQDDGTLDADTLEAMKAHDFLDYIIVGGTSAVSDSVLEQLGGSFANIVRLDGDSRYETCAKAARYTCDNSDLSFASVAVATGRDFPDALSGSVYAAQSGGILVLAEENAAPVFSLLATQKDTIEQITYLGGTDSLTSFTRNLVVVSLS